jgi:hypothetical protein
MSASLELLEIIHLTITDDDGWYSTAHFLGAQRKNLPPLFPAKIEWPPEVRIRLETFDRARHRQELNIKKPVAVLRGHGHSTEGSNRSAWSEVG